MTLLYVTSLILFGVLSAVGCTVPAIIAASVFLGLLVREFARDIRRAHERSKLRAAAHKG